MYTCNDCGAKFDAPENDACPKCGCGDYFEETLEDVVAEADDKNSKGFAVVLRQFGEDYIRYKNQAELAKKCTKDLLEAAKDKGITKDMLMAYVSAVQLEDFNAKVLCGAIQQDLGLENGTD